jgi:16S rRNA (cytosine967-C5)-methyltransferase
MTTESPPNERELIRSAAALGHLGTLTLELWQRTRIDWGFASNQLADAFRARRLGGRERRLVAETLFGMIRHARRLDEALAAGGARAGAAAPDYDRLLAYLVLEEGLAPAEAARHRPAIDWRAVAAIDDELARIRAPAERIARRHSLPDWLAARLFAEWGDDAESLAASLNERAPMTVRVNRLRAEPDEVIASLADEGIEARRGEFAASALHVETRTNLFGLRAFREGMFEAQDEGSQLIAELLAPPPKGLVVDLCAGAGGKTLALAAMLENRGRILAADIDGRKLVELRRRARRGGVSNVQAVEISGDVREPLPAPLARIEGKADRVLVDAPCTGVGSLRRNPEARWRLTEADTARLPAVQRGICERAIGLLAPGARLIYATCTVLAAENRQVVSALRQAHPELELVAPKEIWGRERAARVTDASGQYLEVLPHRHGTDGFFAAILRRPKT